MLTGIIGAGTMGSAIAQVFAQSGNSVILTDLTLELAQKGKTRIEESLSKKVNKGKITKDEQIAVLSRIAAGVTADCGECDFVLEAAVENADIKRATFALLDEICPKNTIFATNTSSLPITLLAAGLSHPLVGMHFFNPATVMELVEVISGLNTPEWAAERVAEIAREIGKSPVMVKDNPGFVVNRILTPMLNEAIAVLAEGTASPEDIDKAMKLGCNLPMGPLALADLCGLDVVLAVCETLVRETGDQKYRPEPLLRKMVRAGRLGVKTGQGFYEYKN